MVDAPHKRGISANAHSFARWLGQFKSLSKTSLGATPLWTGRFTFCASSGPSWFSTIGRPRPRMFLVVPIDFRVLDAQVPQCPHSSTPCAPCSNRRATRKHREVCVSLPVPLQRPPYPGAIARVSFPHASRRRRRPLLNNRSRKSIGRSSQRHPKQLTALDRDVGEPALAILLPWVRRPCALLRGSESSNDCCGAAAPRPERGRSSARNNGRRYDRCLPDMATRRRPSTFQRVRRGFGGPCRKLAPALARPDVQRWRSGRPGVAAGAMPFSRTAAVSGLNGQSRRRRSFPWYCAWDLRRSGPWYCGFCSMPLRKQSACAGLTGFEP